MKKSSTYLVDDEIDLRELIKKLWKEKILILSISIICGLLGYFYALLKPQEFKSEITLKNPPVQIFEPYNLFNNNFNNNNNNNNNNIVGQFISDFKLNFLSLNNVENFLEESREFDNFKGYLKSRNISAKEYFTNKISEAKEKNIIIPNKYSLNHTKELNGAIFFNNYVQFVKKKTVLMTKKIFKLAIEDKIIIYDQALDKAKLINLENPILTSAQSHVIYEPEDLFYKGSKILSQDIIYLKRLLTKLENDQFNYEIIIDKSLNSPVKEMINLKYFVTGLIFGLLFSILIVFFRIQTAK